MRGIDIALAAGLKLGARNTLRRCPACGAETAELIHQLDLRAPDGHPLQSGYPIVACAICGTGFANVEINSSYYDHYYAEMAKYSHDAATATGSKALAVDTSWDVERLRITAEEIASLVPGPAARIVDIGCANGTLLGALQRLGFANVVGVDPSPVSASVARELYGVEVGVGTFSAMPPDLGTFDCVCLTGVLEHLWDVDEAMARMLDLLRPGGIIYMGVPDAAGYLDPYIGPFQDFSTEHVNHFSPATLGVLANRFGLEAIWSRSARSELVPGAWCADHRVAWRRAGLPLASPAIVRDEALVDVLREFTRRSTEDFGRIRSGLALGLAGYDRYAVWGTGEMTMKLLALPELAARTLVGLLDGNAGRQGMRFGGVPVVAPDDLADRGAPIVIGSVLSMGPILDEMHRRGFTNPVITLA